MKTLSLHKLASILLALFLLITAAAPAAAAGESEGMLSEIDAVFDVQFSGVIDTVNPWKIAGQPVAVDDNTHIVLTTGTAAPGMWASVQARRLADDSLLAGRITVRPPEMRLKGPVQAKPTNNLGAWTIAGQTFLVDEDTRINLRAGPIKVGTWVEVVAVEKAGGLLALRIQPIETNEDVEVHGAIQAFGATAWKISGVPVAANASTLIIGEPKIGLLATALATLQDNNTLLARAFKVNWLEPERQRQPVQLKGTVEALPASGLIGAWTVEGRTVQVSDATRIFQVKGIVAIGAEVHVIGWEEDGDIVAVVITVLGGPVNAARRFQLEGEIGALPPNGTLYGKWIINQDGEQFEVQVHLRTRIMGAEHAKVGATVEVGGIQLRDGTRIATWVRVHAAGN